MGSEKGTDFFVRGRGRDWGRKEYIGIGIGIERNTSGSTIGIDPDGGKGILYDNRRKEKQALAACGRACFGYDD
jgi:hypothetical protein